MKWLSDKGLLNLLTVSPFIFYCIILGHIGMRSKIVMLDASFQTRLYSIIAFATISVLLHFFLLFVWLHRHYNEPDRNYRLKTIVLGVFCTAGAFAFMMMM